MSQANLPPGFPPPMGYAPPPMGFQQPPPGDFGNGGRPGTPWMIVVVFALLGLGVGFAGGTGFGYVVGHGGPAMAGAAARAGRSDPERARITASTIQTLRSQLMLYRLQHNDNYPTLEQLQDNWRVIVQQTDVQGAPATARRTGMVFGPYMQSLPVNPLNGKSGVCPIGSPTADAGWAYDPETGLIKAISPAGSAGDAMGDDMVARVLQ